MRRTVAGPVKADKGQIVRFHLQLKPGQAYAFCQLFSSFPGDYEPSPHVSTSKLDLLENGRPRINSPISFRLLSSGRSEFLVEIDVKKSCQLSIVQDLDVATDQTITAKGRAYGKNKERALSAIRWLLGNPDWPIRRDDGQIVRIDF